MRDRVNTLLAGRREKIGRALGRPLSPAEPRGDEVDEKARDHLLDEARALYRNELEWEYLMDEEEVTEGARIVGLTFPGFLALIRGLLLEEAMPDALAPADPRPEVVEEVARFLARRIVELQDELDEDAEDGAHLELELTLTDGLLDQVLYYLHGLSRDEVERVEAASGES